MKKDFKKWHVDKSDIHIHKVRAHFHEREIWFGHIGVNVGFEQDGQGELFLRPVIIIRKFNNEIFWGIPLTKSSRRKNKKTEKYYYTFSFVPGILSVAILSQLRLFDGKRLARLIGFMDEKDFHDLKQKLKELIP